MGIIYKLMRHRNLNMSANKPLKNTKNKSDRNRLITIEGNIIEAPLSTSVEPAEGDLTKNMETSMDREFTAEHIIQLCRFLAEKSKRNKNLYKQQQSPKKLTKSKQSQFPFEPMEYEDNDDDIDCYQNEALPLLNKHKLELSANQHAGNANQKGNSFVEQPKTSAVLSARLSPDINSLNISSNTLTTAASCALQHHQQQHQQPPQHIYNYQHQQHLPPQLPTLVNQGKRDILLKIRRQIFERKRLRENGSFEPQAFNNSTVWRPW